jgi:hypothetical protein
MRLVHLHKWISLIISNQEYLSFINSGENRVTCGNSAKSANAIAAISEQLGGIMMHQFSSIILMFCDE